MKAQRGARFSLTLYLTSKLDGMGGQRKAPAALTPEKTRYTLYRLGGTQGRCWRMRKISPPPPLFDPRTVQPVASSYSDWAIPAIYIVLVHCYIYYKGFLMVSIISNSLLPLEANVCIMFIYKLWAVDQKGYLTCRSWTKTDVTFFLTKGTQLTVGENGYAWLTVHMATSPSPHLSRVEVPLKETLHSHAGEFYCFGCTMFHDDSFTMTDLWKRISCYTSISWKGR